MNEWAGPSGRVPSLLNHLLEMACTEYPTKFKQCVSQGGTGILTVYGLDCCVFIFNLSLFRPDVAGGKVSPGMGI